MNGRENGTLADKIDAIRDAMRWRGSVVVGLSGGVDSALLAWIARDALGDNAMAVTLDSEFLPRKELEWAKQVAKRMGIRHAVVRHSAISEEKVVSNPRDRCYHCKKGDVYAILEEAKKYGITTVAFGATASDFSDYRPGIGAASELGVWQPLLEFGLTKDEVRIAARDAGLPVWDKPAAACLASRIECGERITEERLDMVERAENYLSDLGFSNVRVRYAKSDARIELPPEEIKRAATLAKEIVEKLKAFGFRRVSLDLEGYRPAGMQ